jgi:hypothetical protein
MEQSAEQKTEQTGSESSQRFDYDNLFKTIFHEYFWDALKIFLPELYEAADRSQPPEFLEQEMRKVTFDLGGGANRTDLLTSIKLCENIKKLVLCHLEQQGQGGDDLPTRMYRYKEAIHLLFGQEPVGIAVITESRPKGEKAFYSWEQFGVEVGYRYVNVVVANLDDDLLLAGENRVGFVLYAAKRAAKCGGDDGKKFRYLREITALWAQRGWPAEEKRIILLAIEHLLRLDSEYYVNRFVEHMETLTESLKEEKDMYVSAFERVYTARGMEKGMEKGREQGREQGIEQGKEEVARNMLSDGLPMDQVARYTSLPREKIEALLS